MTSPPETTEIIRKMKGLPDGRGVKFPIRDGELNVIGYLRGIDRHSLNDSELICTMARYHTLYKKNFLTQFDVSPENKINWLENSVLYNDLKMLFLVETSDGRTIGQDGFTLLDNETFEHDGTMRWKRGGQHEIFIRSAFERAAICFFLLGCEKFKVEIIGKNTMALDNAFALGMKVIKEHHLTCLESDGVVSYRIATDRALVNTTETLVELSMEKSVFAESNRVLIENPCWEGIFPVLSMKLK
jgi:hypothetical protein